MKFVVFLAACAFVVVGLDAESNIENDFIELEENDQINVEDDKYCKYCNERIATLKNDFTSFHKSTYKYALEKSCDQEKNSEESCRKFVDKYFEKIYAKELIDLGPSFCVDIGACSAAESTKEADLNENVGWCANAGIFGFCT